jgi:hypothetical protein
LLCSDYSLFGVLYFTKEKKKIAEKNRRKKNIKYDMNVLWRSKNGPSEALLLSIQTAALRKNGPSEAQLFFSDLLRFA